jgi:hypothetical protein
VFALLADTVDAVNRSAADPQTHCDPTIMTAMVADVARLRAAVDQFTQKESEIGKEVKERVGWDY